LVCKLGNNSISFHDWTDGFKDVFLDLVLREITYLVGTEALPCVSFERDQNMDSTTLIYPSVDPPSFPVF
jgi:hypothetical protein